MPRAMKSESTLDHFILKGFFVLAFAILVVKFFAMAGGYHYVFRGFDAAYLLDIVQRTLGSQTLYYEHVITTSSPHYLPTILKLITNVSTVDILFIPSLVIVILGFFLIFILGRTITKNNSIALLAAIFWATSVVLNQIHVKVIYGFFIQALLFWTVIKYFRQEINSIFLFLILMASLMVYPPIAIISWVIIGLFALGKLIQGFSKNNSNLIKRSANYFLIIPLVLLTFYLGVQALVPSHYQGIERFFWHLMGLRRANIDIIGYLYFVIYFSLILSLGLFLSKSYRRRLSKFFQKINFKWFKKITEIKTSKESIFNSFLRILIGVMIGLALINLITTAYYVLIYGESLSSNFAETGLFAQMGLGKLLHLDFWNIKFFSFLPHFLIGILGLVLIKKTKPFQTNKSLILIFIPNNGCSIT